MQLLELKLVVATATMLVLILYAVCAALRLFFPTGAVVSPAVRDAILASFTWTASGFLLCGVKAGFSAANGSVQDVALQIALARRPGAVRS